MLPNQLNVPKTSTVEESSLYGQSVAERYDERQQKSARQFEKDLEASKQQQDQTPKRGQDKTQQRPHQDEMTAKKAQKNNQRDGNKTDDGLEKNDSVKETRTAEADGVKRPDKQETKGTETSKQTGDFTSDAKSQQNSEKSSLTNLAKAGSEEQESESNNNHWQSLLKQSFLAEENSANTEVEEDTGLINTEAKQTNTSDEDTASSAKPELKNGLVDVALENSQAHKKELASDLAINEQNDQQERYGKTFESDEGSEVNAEKLNQIAARLDEKDGGPVKSPNQQNENVLDNLIKVINYAKPDGSASQTAEDNGEASAELVDSGADVTNTLAGSGEGNNEDSTPPSLDELQQMLSQLTEDGKDNLAQSADTSVVTEHGNVRNTEVQDAETAKPKVETNVEELASVKTKDEQEWLLNNQIRFALASQQERPSNNLSSHTSTTKASEALTPNSYLQWQTNLSKQVVEQQKLNSGSEQDIAKLAAEQALNNSDEGVTNKVDLALTEARQSTLQSISAQSLNTSLDSGNKGAQVEVLGVQMDKTLVQPKLESVANARQEAMIKENVLFNKQELAANMQQQVSLMMARNLKSVDIRLDPPELGSMQVKLNLNGEQAAVSFVVSSQQAKDALEGSLPKLRELLEQQGMQLSDSDVKQEKGQTGDGQPGGGEAGQLAGNFDDESEQEEVAATMMQQNVNSPWNVDYYA